MNMMEITDMLKSLCSKAAFWVNESNGPQWHMIGNWIVIGGAIGLSLTLIVQQFSPKK